MAICLIYTPCKNRNQAERIAKRLIEERLVACANIFDAESIYFWKGKLCNDNEAVLLCKTTRQKAAKASEKISKLHSYECPAIITVNADANREFEEWLINFLS